MSAHAGYRINSNVKLEGWLETLRTVLGTADGGPVAALEDAADGVLVSRFADGWIVFNSGKGSVTKSLGLGKAGRQTVELPPLALRWISAK
jgi:hypothetical protein